MVKVLVTGATGYLGRVLVERLLESDPMLHVIGTYRAEPPDLPANDRLSFVSFDEVIEGTFNLDGIHFICNLIAARLRGDESGMAQSITDVRILVGRAAKAKVKGIIHSSSHAVYGTASPMWSETDLPVPVTPHGWTKFAIEELFKLATPLGTKTISLRLPKLIGPGPLFRFDQGEILHSLALAAVKRQTPFISPGFLEQCFDLLDVRDAADAFVRVLRVPTSTWPDVLNFGTGITVRGAEIIRLVDMQSKEKYGLGLSVRIRPEPGRLRDFGMDVSALHSLLGSLPHRSLSTTLEDVLTLLCRKPSSY